MGKPAETFTPEHVGLIYRMYRKATSKFVISGGKNEVLRRQRNHWAKRWAAIPGPDLMAAYSARQI
jgi:hypothetical protein